MLYTSNHSFQLNKTITDQSVSVNSWSKIMVHFQPFISLSAANWLVRPKY